MTKPEPDPATLSNFADIATSHLHLKWKIDFDARKISGSATHTLQKHNPDVKEVVFDTSFLDIESVTVDEQDAKFTLAKRHAVMGSALHISLPEGTQSTVKCTISYSTTKDCTAIGWLEKEQTASGNYPFLYSQGQAIHNRSMIPLQDTPFVKLTYSAEVTSIYPVLMSSLRINPPPEKQYPLDGQPRTYTFDQPVTIPSYLIAVASGELEFSPLGPRTGVYAEPLVLKDAVWEFKQDAERLLDVAEKLTIPYAFTRYDVLVLPNSFPYGGMENTNLTFLTPTLLAGDRSLVDVVAHEMSHSWFGNLCTTASWVHFWLNEGFTTYLERLILRDIHGEPSRGMSYVIGSKALHESLKRQEGTPRFQRLVVPYNEGEDPDDAFSSVPYEKGSNFALYLERLVGGLDVFLPCLKDYLTKNAGKAITTTEWKDHLYGYFKENNPDVVKKLDQVDWDAWFNGEGLELPVKMEYDTSLVDAARALAKRWDESRGRGDIDFSKKDIESFSSEQIMVFLEAVEELEKLDKDTLYAFDKAYKFNLSKNSEIKFRWLLISLKAEAFAQDSAEWVARQGRMKFARKIYQKLYQVEPELARMTFQENKFFYHPIARQMIEKDLKLKK